MIPYIRFERNPPKVHQCCNYTGHGASNKPPSTLGESECGVDALSCLPNRLMQFPALIPKAEPPGENAETCLNTRVVLVSHNNLDGSDKARLMSTNTRTYSCCASKLFQICGRQAILLESVGNGRPDACGVQRDCFRVLRRLLVPPVASMPKSHAASATGIWRSLTLRILLTLFARSLRWLTIIDLLFLRERLAFVYVLELQCDAAY